MGKQLLSNSDWKLGRNGIFYFSSVSGQMKKLRFDSMGRWIYQLFERGNNIHSVTFSIYNCCKIPSKKLNKTDHYQQELMLSYLN